MVELVDETGKRIVVVAREADLADVRVARARLNSDQQRLTYAEVLEPPDHQQTGRSEPMRERCQAAGPVPRRRAT